MSIIDQLPLLSGCFGVEVGQVELQGVFSFLRVARNVDWRLFLSVTTYRRHVPPVTGSWKAQIYYSDAIMSATASLITGDSIVCSTVYSGADQRKHQSSASLAFVRGIHRWPVNSPHKGPVTRKMFPFDDVIVLADIQCKNTVINILWPKQTKWPTFKKMKFVFLNENFQTSHTISLNMFLSLHPTDDMSSLVQIIAWHRADDKTLPDPIKHNKTYSAYHCFMT